MSLAVDALIFTGSPLAVLGYGVHVVSLLKGDQELDHLSDLLQTVGCGLIFVATVLDGSLFFPWGVLNGAIAVYCAIRWWKNRRNGRWKKAARELGEKSKARVQALVEQMTPSPIPSPAGGGS